MDLHQATAHFLVGMVESFDVQHAVRDQSDDAVKGAKRNVKVFQGKVRNGYNDWVHLHEHVANCGLLLEFFLKVITE